ncbi:serine hydrolase domain-containing protein [Achromobacter spanius]|uniref:Beta-lactamase n=1 Tax=Achromobacter spanius TaxID=217203 RepID=A0AAW3I8B7_9BURK|nr:serine hydrolase domain-containing protein [Achromobacter spanius]KNE29054.1 beta-lactamase [Achromobacter spanius]MCW3153617.1 beta-lactamase family protein [Achromobacter spanius]
MFSLSRLVAIGSLLLAAGGCQSLPPAAPATIAKDDYATVLAYLALRIPHDMDAAKVPGVSIAIVDDQRIVWSTGFGYADASRHRLATRDTLYRVGAISKLVTAAAVLRAADDGRLLLDAPAGDALPDWHVEPRRNAMQWMGSEPYTARNLLSLHPATLEDTMGRARADMAYALLGDMVAHVAHEPFDTYVRRTILQPLNMPRAGFQPHARMLEQRASGYRRGQPWTEAPQPNQAADGLWMSASEMARFSSMLFAGGNYGDKDGDKDGDRYNGKRVLTERSARMLLGLETVAGGGLDLDCRFAVSWLAAPCGDDLVSAASVREHSGATEAFHARWVLAPREKLAVLVMSNADSGESLVASVSTMTMRMMRQAKYGR